MSFWPEIHQSPYKNPPLIFFFRNNLFFFSLFVAHPLCTLSFTFNLGVGCCRDTWIVVSSGQVVYSFQRVLGSEVKLSPVCCSLTDTELQSKPFGFFTGCVIQVERLHTKKKSLERAKKTVKLNLSLILSRLTQILSINKFKHTSQDTKYWKHMKALNKRPCFSLMLASSF